MGRMLDVLKSRSETKTTPSLAPSEAVNEWALREDELHFVEVGPNRTLAGSPTVMAASPRRETPRAELPQPVQPPHPPTTSLLTANLVETRPSVSITFEEVNPAPVELGRVGPEIITYHQPNNPIAQQYAGLVNQLLADEASRVLLLSGVRSGVGTSTVLLNLAVAAAMKAQKRVAIVETQRQRPSLAGKLGLKPLAFLQDVLSGTISIEQALIKSPLPRLALLAASTARPEIGLAVTGLTWLLAWLKERNDLVLIDGPTLEEQGDLSRLAPLTDSMFVVMPQGENPAQGRPLLQLVQRIGGRLRGLLHTQLSI